MASPVDSAALDRKISSIKFTLSRMSSWIKASDSLEEDSEQQFPSMEDTAIPPAHRQLLQDTSSEPLETHKSEILRELVQELEDLQKIVLCAKHRVSEQYWLD